MKAGLGHKWDTHCLQHDISNMMFTTSWSTQCLNVCHFLATVMIIRTCAVNPHHSSALS